MNFSNFAFLSVLIFFSVVEATQYSGYGGGYGMRCPGNMPPLPGTNNQPLPCQNNQTCGSNSYFCQANPVRGQPGVCCPFCPNTGEPAIDPATNRSQTCQADADCGKDSSAYFCSMAPGAPKLCCPRCLNGAEPKPQSGYSSGPSKPMTCQTDSECGNDGYFCVASNPLQTSNPAKVCCPLCPGNGRPMPGGTGTAPKTCDTPECCGTDHFCSPSPVKGNPKLCCPLCVAGGPPLANPDSSGPLTCDTDQCCNSPAHYCAKNPLKTKKNVCCAHCKCGSPPLLGPDNQLLPCETDQCCTDPNYYCFASNVTGKPNVCCPKGPEQGGKLWFFASFAVAFFWSAEIHFLKIKSKIRIHFSSLWTRGQTMFLHTFPAMLGSPENTF